jgi:hypothetical protein
MRKALVTSVVIFVVAVFATPIVQACMAVNSPGLRIIREPSACKHARVRAVAYFSEYDCYAMTPKTYCAIGLRLPRT